MRSSIGRTLDVQHSTTSLAQPLHALQPHALEDDYAFDDDELDEFLRHDTLEQEKAISDEGRALITEFNRELNQQSLKECNVCNERWFDLHVDAEGRCRKYATAISNDNPSKFSAANLIDPDDVPADLPLLSIISHGRDC